jgi:hypothetical protein
MSTQPAHKARCRTTSIPTTWTPSDASCSRSHRVRTQRRAPPGHLCQRGQHRNDQPCKGPIRSAAGLSGRAEYLAVDYNEPAVARSRPPTPSLGDPLKIGPRRQPSPHCLLGKRRADNPVSPHPSPPAAVLGGREAPHRGRRDHLRKSRATRPTEQSTTGGGITTAVTNHPQLQVQPAVEDEILRVPDRRGVVAVASGDDPSRPTSPPQLHQRGDRVTEVLKQLMGVDNVEDAIGDGQPVGVTDAELDVGDALSLATRRLDHLGGTVDTNHSPGRHPAREVDRDRSRAAADVEHIRSRHQPVKEVGSRVGGGSPPVRTQHALVMTVSVCLASFGHAPSMHGNTEVIARLDDLTVAHGRDRR